MPIICIDCQEKDHELYQLKSKLSEYDTILKKVRPIIGAFAAQASSGPLREARTKIYKEIEDALA